MGEDRDPVHCKRDLERKDFYEKVFPEKRLRMEKDTQSVIFLHILA